VSLPFSWSAQLVLIGTDTAPIEPLWPMGQLPSVCLVPSHHPSLISNFIVGTIGVTSNGIQLRGSNNHPNVGETHSGDVRLKLSLDAFTRMATWPHGHRTAIQDVLSSIYVCTEDHDAYPEGGVGGLVSIK